MRIRPANLADADTIVQFNCALAEETEGRKLDPARIHPGVRAVLNDPAKGLYFIAEVDGRIAGQLMITCEWSDWRNGNFWWIQSVYVAEPFRKAGVFKALYHHIEKEARARNDICGIRLYVDAHNSRAQAAYERLGMKPSEYRMFETDFVLSNGKHRLGNA